MADYHAMRSITPHKSLILISIFCLTKAHEIAKKKAGLEGILSLKR